MYYVYILTNKHKNVLYIGMTNSLANRLVQHRNSQSSNKLFVGKYNCAHLIYYEAHQTPSEAIRREKVIKGKSRMWKDQLISSFNPEWEFLEHQLPSE